MKQIDVYAGGGHRHLVQRDPVVFSKLRPLPVGRRHDTGSGLYHLGFRLRAVSSLSPEDIQRLIGVGDAPPAVQDLDAQDTAESEDDEQDEKDGLAESEDEENPN